MLLPFVLLCAYLSVYLKHFSDFRKDLYIQLFLSQFHCQERTAGDCRSVWRCRRGSQADGPVLLLLRFLDPIWISASVTSKPPCTLLRWFQGLMVLAHFSRLPRIHTGPPERSTGAFEAQKKGLSQDSTLVFRGFYFLSVWHWESNSEFCTL